MPSLNVHTTVKQPVKPVAYLTPHSTLIIERTEKRHNIAHRSYYGNSESNVMLLYAHWSIPNYNVGEVEIAAPV